MGRVLYISEEFISFPTAMTEQCWEEVSGLTTVLQGGHWGHKRTKCNQMRGPLWLAQLLRVWKGSGISRLSDGWAAVGLLDERGSVAARCTWELPQPLLCPVCWP